MKVLVVVSPQGLCLGPLLLLMYINDLPQASKFQTTLFADDMYLCLSDTNINNSQIRVNAELQNKNFWLWKNKLSLKYNKTNFTLIKKEEARRMFHSRRHFEIKPKKTNLKPYP